ncbi:MAG TPA: hypothetical protein VH306_15265, partial [Gaiellaceae bacterium]
MRPPFLIALRGALVLAVVCGALAAPGAGREAKARPAFGLANGATVAYDAATGAVGFMRTLPGEPVERN